MARIAFGQFLAKQLKSAEKKQKEVAGELGVSAALVSQWISGKKRPTSEKVAALAEVLHLEAEDRRKLFELSEMPHALPEAEDLIAEINKTLGDPRTSDADRKELVLAIDDAFHHWDRVRDKGVRWCIIPTAGWQARWLGHDPVAELVECVARDALAAKLDKVIVVVRRDSELRLPKDLRRIVHIAWQDQPSGTAHSVQTGLDQAGVESDEPFAVFFPDERVSRNLVAEMVESYNRNKVSVIAIRRVSRGRPDKFGCVTVEHDEDRAYHIRTAEEMTKRAKSGGHFAIVGRYVFSPHARRLLGLRDNVYQEVSLTATVARLAQENRVAGFEVRKDEVLSIVAERKKLEEQLKEFVTFAK